MENNQSLSKKKLLSIKEERLLRQVDYDTIAGVSSRSPKHRILLDLEILKNPPQRAGAYPQRVLVSIKPRVPAIKTLYIAEKSRFFSKKGSDKSGSRSRLAIGDHSSLNSSLVTTFSVDDIQSVAPGREKKATTTSPVESGQITSSELGKSASVVSVPVWSAADHQQPENSVYRAKKRTTEKCYVYTQQPFTLNLPKFDIKEEQTETPKFNTSQRNLFSDEIKPINPKILKRLTKRIEQLERKLLQQEMVIRSLEPNPYSSSHEECEESNMRASGSGRPCCSYIEQYSHVPETSAFQRYTQPLSPSKATTLEKEHNSEQYGRDFTAYDGITTRGRRQSASVPCKRDEFPKMAAERVHKIRHKLNPVRDYRLMDTVHYLAQGEFAPRDDGIKLTPSREAVLSDIIWEDVCRTHWPNTRLGRRAAPERCGMRCELQRLIDSLLRERVAHVERRRRRHYRIVKLNHRHESCRPVGKTGDIIVASHKNREGNEERELPISDNAGSAMVTDRRWEQKIGRKGYKSHDRLYQESRRKRFQEEECSPGPSYAVSRGPGRQREPTCCYHSVSPPRPARAPLPERPRPLEITSASSTASKGRSPRLVVKKDQSRSRRQKEEPNLEQYILLPTLVIRTPSNVKRQKKFNELYHRILNVHMNNNDECAVDTESAERDPNPSNIAKKDIGFNINITLTSSAENIHRNSKPI